MNRSERADAREEAREAKQFARAEAREAKREAKADAKAGRSHGASEGTTRSGWKRAALFTGRGLAGLLGIGVTIVVLTGIAFIPWPSWGVSAPVTNVDPTAQAQQRVCPGPLLTVGATAAEANRISSLGPVTVLSTGGVASTLNSSNQSAAQDGEPQLFTAAANAAPIAASQTQAIAQENYAGLTVAACTEPGSDSWLVGGSTALGNTSLLVLSNPSTQNATAIIDAFGANGPIDISGLGGVSVPAGAQVAIPLAGYLPNESTPILHVTSTGGQISAVIDTTQISDLTPVGAEVVGPSAAPATKLVIPGLVVDASIISAEKGDGVDGAATLRLLAPEADTTATVSVTGDQGAPGNVYTAHLSKGSVASVGLNSLAPGSYTVSVSADSPVVASTQSALTATEGTDFAWFASANALSDSVALAVPAAGTLHLSNQSGTAANVTLAGASSTQLTVPPNSSLSLPIAAGSWTASGVGGLFASLSLQAPGQLASMVVPGANVDAASVAVYTR